jgi:hypothetical protein
MLVFLALSQPASFPRALYPDSPLEVDAPLPFLVFSSCLLAGTKKQQRQTILSKSKDKQNNKVQPKKP